MVMSIASQKGGTGKTTTSISLTAGLGRSGKRILLVDMDSQANSSKVLLPDYINLRSEETIVPTMLDRKPLQIHKSSVPQRRYRTCTYFVVNNRCKDGDGHGSSRRAVEKCAR